MRSGMKPRVVLMKKDIIMTVFAVGVYAIQNTRSGDEFEQGQGGAVIVNIGHEMWVPARRQREKGPN